MIFYKRLPFSELVTLFVSIEPGSDPMLRGSIIILSSVGIGYKKNFNFVYLGGKCLTGVLCAAVDDI